MRRTALDLLASRSADDIEKWGPDHLISPHQLFPNFEAIR